MSVREISLFFFPHLTTLSLNFFVGTLLGVYIKGLRGYGLFSCCLVGGICLSTMLFSLIFCWRWPNKSSKKFETKHPYVIVTDCFVTFLLWLTLYFLNMLWHSTMCISFKLFHKYFHIVPESSNLKLSLRFHSVFYCPRRVLAQPEEA